MPDAQDPWEQDVARLWATAAGRPEAEVLADVRALAARRPDGDPAALFELASAHDYAEQEAEAEPLYRRALAGGLAPDRQRYAAIQLASTLRNLGRPHEAAQLLQDELAAGHDDGLDDARTAFLALALLDADRPHEALAGALTALARHLPEYGRAVTEYAQLLRQR